MDNPFQTRFPLLQAETSFLSPDLGAMVFSLIILFLWVVWLLKAFRVFEQSVRAETMPSAARSSFRRSVYIALFLAVCLVGGMWLIKDWLFIDVIRI